MDRPTQEYYSQHAAELACCYGMAAGGLVASLPVNDDFGRKVLDVGCGTGRDVRDLLKRGCDAFGADPCPEMVREARKTLEGSRYSPEGRLFVAALPDLKPFDSGEFDVVLCSAVLMHIPEESIFDAVYGLRRVLKTGGTLLLSIPASRPDVDPATSRDSNQRLFTDLPPAKVQLLFERVGFRLEAEDTSEDALERTGVRWTSFRFTRLDEKAGRPLHLVESILNRDRKDATYKLALFRALAELAQTEHHLAIFTRDDKVKIPVEAIADKWLLYYWPIFASDTFICQKNGECPGSVKPVAIRKPLKELIDNFGVGGLTAFHADWKSDRLAGGLLATLQKARSKLKQTVWTMPVRFAGGGDDFSVFQYDAKDQTVSMRADLWRELCLTGSWIHDATILRWAELTERLSKGALKASQVLDCLLTIPDPGRKVGEAKSCFKDMAEKKCVWSEKELQNDHFEVDHALPFSLWRNNDLWNLFPTAPQVNRLKRDRLPTHDLLHARRDLIVGCWRGLHEAMGVRFVREAQTLLGRDDFRPATWEVQLFARMVEACEITATQRGAERWQPDDFTGVAMSKPLRVAPAAGPYYPIVEERLVVSSVLDEREAPQMIPFSQIQQEAFIRYLPVVGSLAAGGPFHGMETGGINDAEELDWVAVPQKMAGKNRFVVRVAGDSMAPGLKVGDLVVFEYHRNPRSDGQIVIVNIPEFGAGEFGTEAIKRIRQDQERWIFESDNPAHPPLPVLKADLDHPILGTFVGKI